MLDDLPGVLDFGKGLYRGDTRVWTHVFNDDPPAWQPDTDYAAGDLNHDSDETYVAQTTCTWLGVPYTCLATHTSDAVFDPAMWVEDLRALGPETDISGYVFLGQYRVNSRPSAELLAEDEVDFETDGTDGRLVRTLTATEADKLTEASVSWDLQGTKDDVVKTFLVAVDVPVLGDYSRAEAP